MKEYKIISVKAGISNKKKDKPSTFSDKLQGFFISDYEISTKKAEAIMQEMNSQGWEVVSAAPTALGAGVWLIVITFEREIR